MLPNLESSVFLAFIPLILRNLQLQDVFSSWNHDARSHKAYTPQNATSWLVNHGTHLEGTSSPMMSFTKVHLPSTLHDMSDSQTLRHDLGDPFDPRLIHF